MNPNNSHRRRLLAELMNELFDSLPFEDAFVLLAKMPNGLLARNVQKMINVIKEAMKNNKLNELDCGPKLTISVNGFIAKHSGLGGFNCVRAVLPIPSLNLGSLRKSSISFYFEMQILATIGNGAIAIGFCDRHYKLENEWLGWTNNSIGLWRKKRFLINLSLNEFGNAFEYFNEGDINGIGIIHHPNLSLECFGTLNGQLFGKIELPSKFVKLELYPTICVVYGD